MDEIVLVLGDRGLVALDRPHKGPGRRPALRVEVLPSVKLRQVDDGVYLLARETHEFSELGRAVLVTRKSHAALIIITVETLAAL